MALWDTGANLSVMLETFFQITTLKNQSYQKYTHKVKSGSGANLGPIRQCNLAFQFGSKHFMDKFIVLQDLWRNLIFSLNWQCNYKICLNWNVNGQQYITHNIKYLCTSTASSVTNPLIYNAGALTTKKHISNNSTGTNWAKYTTYLSTQHQWWSTIRLLPLTVYHRIYNKYPKLLSIPILNTAHDAVHVSGTTMIGTLHPIEIKDIEVSNVSWTKTKIHKPQIVHQNSWLCFLNKISNHNKIIWSNQ